jgi:hypothetical protein
MTVPARTPVEAVVPGNFKFKCLLKDANGKTKVLDPDDPAIPGGGGELEVVIGD